MLTNKRVAYRLIGSGGGPGGWRLIVMLLLVGSDEFPFECIELAFSSLPDITRLSVTQHPVVTTLSVTRLPQAE